MPAKPPPFKRGGLHKVYCPGCDAFTYSTLAQLERHGLPVCRCGEDFTPDELEVAFLLGLEDAPVVVEWRRRTRNSELAQCRAVGWERAAERHAAGTLAPMDVKHADEMRVERREMARKRRLAALLPVPVASDPIPF